MQHSRSFYLSLQSLPSKKRDFVGLCYLVARLADTLSDSGRWSSSLRVKYLDLWEDRLRKSSSTDWEINESLGTFTENEIELLLAGQGILENFFKFETADRDIALDLFSTLFKGMRWFIDNFKDANVSEPCFAVADRQVFDWYCYSHAGCVGRFWVQIFGLPVDRENLAIEYGKALERINILRDLVDDREQGRVLLPRSELQAYGLRTDKPWLEGDAWSKYQSDYIRETRKMLIYGTQFCDSIPFNNFKLRFSSMIPLKIGWQSLDLFEAEKEKTQTTKISRREVGNILRESIVDLALNRRLNRRYIRRMERNENLYPHG